MRTNPVQLLGAITHPIVNLRASGLNLLKAASLPASTRALVAVSLALGLMPQNADARLYDRFDSGANWTLTQNSGTASIGSSQLTLTAPSGVNSTPTATLNAAQGLTGTRQSILVRNHTGSFNHSAFFLLAASGGNQLELKIDDSTSPANVVAGYWIGSTYTWVASTPYSPGTDGLYMAFQELSGTTYWQISTDAATWTTVGSKLDPVSTTSMSFSVQHKGYSLPPAQSSTIVDCFNYKATGVGYHSIQEKTYTTGDGWQLYKEAFTNGNYACQNGACDTHIFVNDVDSTQHWTDSSIPLPRVDTAGITFEIQYTDMVSKKPVQWYDNAYRYQNLAFVDADNWTYHLYFKYTYPQYIQQGLEFPLNKYTGSNREQAAVAWYPVRDGSNNGKWSIWTGSIWTNTTYTQSFTPGQWYEVTFTVGLHDNTVYYTSFQAGPPSALTTFNWNHSYGAPSSGFGSKISPAVQMDDNIQDTTQANTKKDCYLAEWHIDWTDERLP